MAEVGAGGPTGMLESWRSCRWRGALLYCTVPYLEVLRGEEGHHEVHLVEPLHEAALGVQDQSLPQLQLVQTEEIHLNRRLRSHFLP